MESLPAEIDNAPSSASTSAAEERQIMRAILGCFLISGAVGLIYEILWIRMLGLIFGHTVFAITTVLAAFMGGLALGSYGFGRLADHAKRQVRLYGCLEIGIGAYCAFLPLFLGWVRAFYLPFAQTASLPFLAFSLLQSGLIALLLLPPTALMGATLPVLVRFFVREEASLGREVGCLYSLNTWGAVFGTLLAGYLLVPALGIRTTLLLAVVTNLGIGTLILVFDRHLERIGPHKAEAVPVTSGPSGASSAHLTTAQWAVALAFGVSGAASMIYEVSWSRALSLVIGSSTYAFTAMLVAFLCGIAGGSWAFAAFAGRRQIDVAVFGWIQIAIGAAALILVPAFGRLPVWFLECFQLSQAPGFVLALQFVVGLGVMLGPTLLIGATFPCAVRAISAGVDRIGSETGWLYAINTAGAILGTVLAGFAGIPGLGVQWTMRAAIWMNLVAGLGVLSLAAREGRRSLWGFGAGLAIGVGIITGLLPAWDPALMSSGVAIYGQEYLPFLRAGEFGHSEWGPKIVSYRDGISATVSVHQNGPVVFLRVNGKTDAGNAGDMHTQLFLGHIPMLLHPAPKRVLVIGLGSGVTAAAVAQYPVDRVDVIEIEPAVVDAAGFFAKENRNVLSDPRVRLTVSDGRNFLETVRKPYDVIISEPSNPWIRGLATLFTQEFFALAKSRLAPNGIMLQWVQGYGIGPDDLRMVARTFLTAFPYSTLWTSSNGDNFLAGSGTPYLLSLQRLRATFDAVLPLREDFARAGFPRPECLLADFVVGPSNLIRYAGTGPLNTDDTLALEFSTPRSLYEERNRELNDGILWSYRSSPAAILTPGDAADLEAPEHQYAVGLGLLAKRRLSDAEAAFARAGRANPAHLPSRLREAHLLIQRGRILPALRILNDVLRRAAREPRAHFLLGLAYQQQGLEAEALEHLRRAATIDPEDVETQTALAQVYRDQGNLAGARAAADVLLRLRPTDAASLLLAAEIRLAQGDGGGVISLLRPPLESSHLYMGSTRANFQHLIGNAQLQTGRYQEAGLSLKVATSLNPLDAGIRLDLSRAYERGGDLEKALDSLDRLLKLQPSHLVARQRYDALLDRMERATP